MNVNQPEGFYPAEIVDELLASRPSTTTLLDSIFLPGRIPRKLLTQMSQDPLHLEKQLLAETPLLSTRIEKPYWSKGSHHRPFDAVTLNVYSSVCLAVDRHLLEAIVAIGGMYADLSGLTLRQSIEMAQVNSAIDFLSYQYQEYLDQKIFSGMYDYFLIDFSRLFRFLDMSNQKKNKQVIVERLRRLSQMLLVLDYEKDGQSLPQYHAKLKLVDHNFIALTVPECVKNKAAIKADTMTHLIVGVNKSFTASLREEGSISRARFIQVYPQLNGNFNLVDFCKSLDAHQREYVHGKFLSDLVRDYYEKKAVVNKPQISRNIKLTMSAVAENKEVILKDFNILLRESKNKKGKDDYQLLYMRDEN